MDADLAELAIFPLPDLVLFPGAALPLHVFEPRYVEMTRDVWAGSHLMAIVRLERGHEEEYLGRPPIHPIATVGEVIACEEIPGGRFAIIVRGRDRIVIERELPPARSYRQVVARRLPDEAVDEAALAVERSQLVAMCEQLAARVGEPAAGLRQLLHQQAPTAELTLALAAALVHDADQRQDLLEMRDPGERVDRLIEHVSALLVRLGPSASPTN